MSSGRNLARDHPRKKSRRVEDEEDEEAEEDEEVKPNATFKNRDKATEDEWRAWCSIDPFMFRVSEAMWDKSGNGLDTAVTVRENVYSDEPRPYQTRWGANCSKDAFTRGPPVPPVPGFVFIFAGDAPATAKEREEAKQKYKAHGFECKIAPQMNAFGLGWLKAEVFRGTKLAIFTTILTSDRIVAMLMAKTAFEVRKDAAKSPFDLALEEPLQ